MIKNYEEKRRLSIHGDTADIFLGISAESIPTKDAHAACEQFDQFLVRINGSQIKRHHIPGTVLNFSNGPWSREEKHAILTVPENEAWANYQKHFPKSPRTNDAVRRMRAHLLEKGAERLVKDPTSIEETSLTEACDKCSPPLKKEAVPVVEKKERRSTNPYGIPSSLATSDKKTYQRLWYRCKSQGIMYEEALKQEGTMKRGKRPAKSATPQNMPEKKPRKAPVKKPRLPFHQTQTGGVASSGPNSQVITSGTPTSPTIYQSNTPALHGLQLKTGDRVRHNGSKASPHFGKEGEILKVGDDGVAFVKFGDVTTWLSPIYLAVVPGVSAS